MDDEVLQEEKSFRMHDDSEVEDDLLDLPEDDIPDFGKIKEDEEDTDYRETL